MYIVTLEIGYSRHLSRNAKLNGAKLEEFDIQYYDPNNDGIVDRYIRVWDVSGYSNGEFTYKATSENSPWNTLSDSIYVK